jgi:hypothetical protein
LWNQGAIAGGGEGEEKKRQGALDIWRRSTRDFSTSKDPEPTEEQCSQDSNSIPIDDTSDSNDNGVRGDDGHDSDSLLSATSSKKKRRGTITRRR